MSATEALSGGVGERGQRVRAHVGEGAGPVVLPHIQGSGPAAVEQHGIQVAVAVEIGELDTAGLHRHVRNRQGGRQGADAVVAQQPARRRSAVGRAAATGEHVEVAIAVDVAGCGTHELTATQRRVRREAAVVVAVDEAGPAVAGREQIEVPVAVEVGRHEVVDLVHVAERLAGQVWALVFFEADLGSAGVAGGGTGRDRDGDQERVAGVAHGRVHGSGVPS